MNKNKTALQILINKGLVDESLTHSYCIDINEYIAAMEEYSSCKSQRVKWENFVDESYYGMSAVRPIGDKEFNSQKLFHLSSADEAKVLCHILNGLDESPTEELKEEAKNS